MEAKTILETLSQEAAHFLSFRPRSEKEIRDFLLKKFKVKFFHSPEFLEIDKEKFISQVIEQLKKHNLINDSQFVSWWLEQRSSFNPKSEKVLRLELRQKGIDEELIEEKLATIDIMQRQQAIRQIIEKKIRLYAGLSKFKLRNKLLRYLINHGFNYDLAKSLVDEFLEKR